MSRSSHARSSAEDAHRWCVAAVDQAIGRLSTEVARMDATDLAGPWPAGGATREECVAALLRVLGAAEHQPEDPGAGRALAAAVVAAWMQCRGRHVAATGLDGQAELLELLATVHRTRVELDAGITLRDVPSTTRVSGQPAADADGSGTARSR